MFKEYIVEVLLLALLGCLAFGLFNPYYMPMGIMFAVLCLLVALFATFVVLMWKEKGVDEREVSIIHQTDRIGFLAGASVLIASVVYETLITHHINEWIIGALGVMVLGKVVSSIYFRSQ